MVANTSTTRALRSNFYTLASKFNKYLSTLSHLRYRSFRATNTYRLSPSVGFLVAKTIAVRCKANFPAKFVLEETGYFQFGTAKNMFRQSYLNRKQ